MFQIVSSLQGFPSHILTCVDKKFVFIFQTFGIILTIGMRAMIDRVSVLGANITVSAALLLGTIVTGNAICCLDFEFFFKKYSNIYCLLTNFIIVEVS